VGEEKFILISMSVLITFQKHGRLERLLSAQFKVFHFQELDWLFYFPSEGNKGKYYGYNVLLKERKRSGAIANNRVTLGDVLERVEVDEHYPHTVGFFKGSCDEGTEAELKYMEIRIIHNVDEFWLFLNALNL
jgi:hypothetical protein